LAHIRLAAFAQLHPHTRTLRRRNGRRIGAIRPDRTVELWYRAALGQIAGALATAGHGVIDGMRAHWPRPATDGAVRVGDERAGNLETLLNRAASRIGNIKAAADRLAALAARKSLGAVDDRLAAELVKAIGINIRPALSEMGPIATAMDQAARANVALIRSIPEQYFNRLRTVISEGWVSGRRWESVAADVAELGEMTDRRAALIARDQTSKMNAAFNEVRQTGLGIDEYSWSGALDARERKSHRAMEGKRLRWDSPPMVDDEAVHPGEAINCRCVAIPIVNLDETGGGVTGEAEREAA
jgi:SPP1 gp7 family putative phage head morphogenesis protein